MPCDVAIAIMFLYAEAIFMTFVLFILYDVLDIYLKVGHLQLFIKNLSLVLLYV